MAAKRSACELPEAGSGKQPKHDESDSDSYSVHDSGSDDDSDCSAADALELQLFASRASRGDRWPLAEPPPEPRIVLATDGPWGEAASGVDIRVCEDPGKGKGVHATKTFKQGMFVGMYVGECCTQRVRNVRHYGADATASEQEALDARKTRLDSLTPELGMPAGGSRNGGSYVFSLLPETSAAVDKYIEAAENDGLVSCIDAEDPALSSWCRYINHAPSKSRACNLNAKVDLGRQLIWFEARRTISPGEEMHFDYGSHYGTMT